MIISMQAFHHIEKKTGSETSSDVLEATQLIRGTARPRSWPSHSETLPVLEAFSIAGHLLGLLIQNQ